MIGKFLASIILIFLVGGFAASAAERPFESSAPWKRCGTDAFSRRVFAEYGAMFFAADSVVVPKHCIFGMGAEVAEFQAGLKTGKAMIGGVEIELQAEAMRALLSAVDEAGTAGLRITPLDGAIAGKRNFADTLRIWNSRFLPALRYWTARGEISKEDAEAAMAMPVIEQAQRVLDWESKRLYFGTGRGGPIMSSVAPPGTSQHLSMLAFDVEQASNSRVRAILNRNGWFQTVVNDSPHFTFLGRDEAELPKAGLTPVTRSGYKYWVPSL